MKGLSASRHIFPDQPPPTPAPNEKSAQLTNFQRKVAAQNVVFEFIKATKFANNEAKFFDWFQTNQAVLQGLSDLAAAPENKELPISELSKLMSDQLARQLDYPPAEFDYQTWQLISEDRKNSYRQAS